MDEANKPQFQNIPLELYEPDWRSKLANTIIELEKLRVKRLGGPVSPDIFFQLKEIFQLLESLGSARIEGNNTTLAEFVEKLIEDPSKKAIDESMLEIFNIERAIEFIEKNVNNDTRLNAEFLNKVHSILVEGLTPPPEGEGSRWPGHLRPTGVSIKGSGHKPPDKDVVREYIDELFDFVNQPLDAQFHLLTVAISHHRMAWIHPYDNGNGRIVRMFTYALLIKQGFQVKSGRILNPTAVFCMDRKEYYAKLRLADSGEKEKVLDWCLYVLEGLRIEIEKIDHLLDLKYTTDVILLPMLSYALERENITKREYEILSAVVKSPAMYIKSADLEKVIGQESPTQRSRILKRLKEKGMLVPLKAGGRIYTIGFTNNYLLRGVIHVLEKNGFIPASLNAKK